MAAWELQFLIAGTWYSVPFDVLPRSITTTHTRKLEVTPYLGKLPFLFDKGYGGTKITIEVFAKNDTYKTLQGYVQERSNEVLAVKINFPTGSDLETLYDGEYAMSKMTARKTAMVDWVLLSLELIRKEVH